MRFLLLIYPDIPQASDEWMPSADTPGAAMGRCNKELSEAGVLLAVVLSQEIGRVGVCRKPIP